MRDPLFPNAIVVAVRELRERIRGRAYHLATLFLVAVGIGVTLLPIGLRVADQDTVTLIGVYAAEDDVAATHILFLDRSLNIPPPGEDTDDWVRPYHIGRIATADEAVADVQGGSLTAALIVARAEDGGLDYAYHSRDVAPLRDATILLAAQSVSLLDWAEVVRGTSDVPPYHQPAFATVNETLARDGERAIDTQVLASRFFLAVVFVVMIFVAILIYGMWVANSVAAEKGSRIMELLIAAASPLQLMLGKVGGTGVAALIQYAAFVTPAVILVALQGSIEAAIFGSSTGGTPLAAVTLRILVAYGVFFVLGFLLYAFLYAAAGSIVSGLDDLQLLAMPMSLLPFLGCIVAIMGLPAIGSPIVVLFSFVPFFSPFVMLARILVGRVEPWEVGLSVGLLVLSIVIAAWLASRVYRAGVLIYGQRTSWRTFLRAAGLLPAG
ncbi:MAG TPA: ABC transporter permease [Candidatus Limnocylindrales bacterium]|nr:ABC transporter permease [Candidatus Limnocylindrales bacterium]